MRPLIGLVLLTPSLAWALEGHWRPSQLKDIAPELAELGLKVPVATLSDPTKAPLGAILDMDVCSGAFVSPDGLVMTAFHCVTDGLLFASGDSDDLFEDGFSASDRAAERWVGPDQGMRLTIAARDVTEDVLAGTKKLEGTERLDRIDDNTSDLVRRCETGPDVHCEVAAYGDGSSYELITQRDFHDVRVVYAPPRTVGYFGGDRDNWQWPRHGGDFAFLRIYASADGKSTAHHPANVPYHPDVWLPIAPEGVGPGEFVMVAGYPNGTYRWRSAAEVDFAQEIGLPVRVQVRRDLLGIIDGFVAKDDGLASTLAPRQLSLSNDLIYYSGTLDQLRRAGAADERWTFERDLARWIAADPARTTEWGTVLDKVHRLQAEEAATYERDQLVRQMVRQVDLLHAATAIWRLAAESEKPDRDRAVGFQNRDRPGIADELDQMDVRFDARVDRAMLRYFLLRLMHLPEGDQVAEVANWLGVENGENVEGAIDDKLADLYSSTDLADSDQRRDLMGTSTWYLEHGDDPWFDLAKALAPFIERMEAEQRGRESEWRVAKPQYLAAVQAFYPEARPRYLAASRKVAPGVFYPDANQTLRVSVGKVDGYFPRDGLIAAAQTTLEGIAGKAGEAPYDAPPELLSAIASKEYGPWVDERLATVPVNFLSTLDTARGSSGSATMNAKGQVVGIIFDGNYESIASDWMFDPAVTRSIHTDIRYVVWYLDRVAGQSALLHELGVEPHFADAAAAAPE